MAARRSALLVLLVVLATATAACAQYPGGQGGTRAGTGGGREGPRPATRTAPAAEAPLNAGALVQTQLDQLEDELRLQPAQRGAWGAYADKVQKLADEVARIRFEARTAPPGPASAPQQLDRIAADMRSRVALVDEIVALGRTLYAALTPEQKAVADRRLALPVSLLATGVMPAATAPRRPPGD